VVPAVEHTDALSLLSPKTIIDVGANKGQFSIVARHLFPDASIHAFEPLDAERGLCEALVADPIVTYSTALSDENGSARFFVASRADSSSLYVPGKNQKAAYGVESSSEAVVPVGRLDEVFQPWKLESPVLLKLDVQGAELQVLRGAERVLNLIDAIYCEVSFVELYERQPCAEEIAAFLAQAGFTLRGAYNLSRTEKFGPTQSDFLFVAKNRA
jgi:FkbM family methyltransferase